MARFLFVSLALCLLVNVAQAFLAPASSFLRPMAPQRPAAALPLRTPAVAKLRMCEGEAAAGDRAAEIREVLEELEAFRNRIIDESTDLGKKVKAKRKDLEKALSGHPDIVQIDAAKEQLQAELEVLEKAA
mmetsp:Transcript_5311/g.8502  ORF Transcript_5311/g.8502 Transcript_5311/m.8502 type:complete len:131 (+) Transcript_5311:161-553(+)|eukprot:CAMPEP_0184294798 /NCGR_PEP_ID=MMETSP1049-20130417/5893_1 /TAXON_ID=77928 /ORGANISM="Proteomonas sulcata, Strain CCMP704" /LENGTH=130 /DNA_ID=CAMNT_0026603201 /DNA_START=149 /DNA_END=541 /DNA_ORIENTATION=+